MASRFLRKPKRSTKARVNDRAGSRSRLRLSFDCLEDRVTPASAAPTNVTMVYDTIAHSLSVSVQQALGSKDTPVYGAVFLEPAEPAAGGGFTAPGNLTSGSSTVSFPSGTTTIGMLVGQTVTGTGIQSGT